MYLYLIFVYLFIYLFIYFYVYFLVEGHAYIICGYSSETLIKTSIYLSIHLSVNPKIGQSNLKQAWNMLIKQKLSNQAELSMSFKWVKSFCETPSCLGFYIQLN